MESNYKLSNEVLTQCEGEGTMRDKIRNGLIREYMETISVQEYIEKRQLNSWDKAKNERNMQVENVREIRADMDEGQVKTVVV